MKLDDYLKICADVTRDNENVYYKYDPLTKRVYIMIEIRYSNNKILTQIDAVNIELAQILKLPDNKEIVTNALIEVINDAILHVNKVIKHMYEYVIEK